MAEATRRCREAADTANARWNASSANKVAQRRGSPFPTFFQGAPLASKRTQNPAGLLSHSRFQHAVPPLAWAAYALATHISKLRVWFWSVGKSRAVGGWSVPVVLPGVANVAGNTPGARQGRGKTWRHGAGWAQSSLKLMSIESVMPSNHLILCCPLLLPPSIFPSIRKVFS